MGQTYRQTDGNMCRVAYLLRRLNNNTVV